MFQNTKIFKSEASLEEFWKEFKKNLFQNQEDFFGKKILGEIVEKTTWVIRGHGSGANLSKNSGRIFRKTSEVLGVNPRRILEHVSSKKCHVKAVRCPGKNYGMKFWNSSSEDLWKNFGIIPIEASGIIPWRIFVSEMNLRKNLKKNFDKFRKNFWLTHYNNFGRNSWKNSSKNPQVIFELNAYAKQISGESPRE